MNPDQLVGGPYLTGLYLENFKGASGAGVPVALRPLTLVYGPNSGGKSTILKALSSIAQTRNFNAMNSERVHWMANGVWFDLGTRHQVLHRGAGKGPNSFKLGFSFSELYQNFPWVHDGHRVAEPSEPLEAQTHLNITPTPFDVEDGWATYRSVFELPGKTPKNHYLLMGIKGPEEKVSERTYLSNERCEYVFMADDSDVGLDTIRGQPIVPHLDIRDVEEHSDSDGYYLKVEYRYHHRGAALHNFKPVLWGFRAETMESRIELQFKHVSTDEFTLSNVDYKEERGGKLVPTLSLSARGKTSLTDKQIKAIFGETDVGITGRSLFDVINHNCPSITDPGTEALLADWRSADYSAALTLAKLLMPLKYSASVGEPVVESGDRIDITLQSRSRTEWAGDPESLVGILRETLDPTLEYSDQVDTFIETINLLLTKHNFNTMSKAEKKALGTFMDPRDNVATDLPKQPWFFLNFLTDYIFPQKEKISLPTDEYNNLRKTEEGTISRNEISRLFGVNKEIFTPAFVIAPCMRVGSPFKFGNLPTVSRWHMGRLYTALMYKLELISSSMSNLDYLGAARLPPRRYYEKSAHGRSGVAGNRSVRSLFTRFPPKSKSLKELNRMMADVLGMQVSLSELKVHRKPTNLFDIRIRRAGSTGQNFAQLPDVGFGVSQTLPLLAALVSEGQRHNQQILVIEEAESNLHPAAQARLMEAILENLDTSDPSPSIVLETHSEHFMLTVLKHLRQEGGLSDDDIAILYVDDLGDGMECTLMETKGGEFLDPWPRSERFTDPTRPII
jgi:energy-coupling factor transporter ATP-binding protein EcfA2